MRYHDPERIQGYCASCDKFGRFWSCPPFEQAPLDLFPSWDHAVIACGKVMTAPEEPTDKLIGRFSAARKAFRTALMQHERIHASITTLVAGYCTGCENCTRPEGRHCPRPSALRYSLEAVGFDVTGLTEQLAGQKLHWPKDGRPEYLMTVGALLCPDRFCADRLVAALDGTARHDPCPTNIHRSDSFGHTNHPERDTAR